MSVSSNGAVKWMGDNFAYYCRRVCKLCNPTDTTKKMLMECPVIKLDAYIYLKKDHNAAQTSALLRNAIEETVTDEMIDDLSHVGQPWGNG